MVTWCSIYNTYNNITSQSQEYCDFVKGIIIIVLNILKFIALLLYTLETHPSFFHFVKVGKIR